MMRWIFWPIHRVVKSASQVHSSIRAVAMRADVNLDRILILAVIMLVHVLLSLISTQVVMVHVIWEYSPIRFQSGVGERFICQVQGNLAINPTLITAIIRRGQRQSPKEVGGSGRAKSIRMLAPKQIERTKAFTGMIHPHKGNKFMKYSRSNLEVTPQTKRIRLH
jgi:hypothetical protein